MERVDENHNNSKIKFNGLIYEKFDDVMACPDGILNLNYRLISWKTIDDIHNKIINQNLK